MRTRIRSGLKLVSVGIAATVLTACGGSEGSGSGEADAAAEALCNDWTWDHSLSGAQNAYALGDVASRFDYDDMLRDIIARARDKCAGHFDEYDAYLAAPAPSDYAEPTDDPDPTDLQSDSPDPEVSDNGPRTYTADSFTSEQKANFVATLRDIEPRFESEDSDVLMALGTEVCESLSNGNSRETVTEVMMSLSGWDGMQAARLTAAADNALC